MVYINILSNWWFKSLLIGHIKDLAAFKINLNITFQTLNSFLIIFGTSNFNIFSVYTIAISSLKYVKQS